MAEYGTMSWAATTGGRLRGMARVQQVVLAMRCQPLRTLAFLGGALATAWVAVAVAPAAARLLTTD